MIQQLDLPNVELHLVDNDQHLAGQQNLQQCRNFHRLDQVQLAPMDPYHPIPPKQDTVKYRQNTTPIISISIVSFIKLLYSLHFFLSQEKISHF